MKNTTCSPISNDGVSEYKSRLTNLIKKNFETDTELSKKILQIIENEEKPNNVVKSTIAVNKLNSDSSVKTVIDRIKLNNNNNDTSKEIKIVDKSIDLCSLSKEVGKCEKSIDKYYYDSKSNQCLVFTYSGKIILYCES